MPSSLVRLERARDEAVEAIGEDGVDDHPGGERAGRRCAADHSDTRPKIIDDSVMRFGAR